MASKENINLNVSLQEAIVQARQDMKNKEGQEGTNQESATEEDSALVPETNIPNSEQAQLISKVTKIAEGINNISDPKKRLKQEICYIHLVEYLKYVQESRLYYFKDYISGKPPEGWTSWFTGLLGNIIRTGFDDITFRPKGDMLWVRVRIFCRVASFTGIVLGCKEEIYWKLNFKPTDGNYITRYTRVLNGDQTITPLDDKCEGNSSSFDGEISGLVGWNANTFKDLAGQMGGCAAAAAVLSIPATITGASAGPVGATAGFSTTFLPAVTACGFDLLGEAWQRTQEFNKDSDTAIDNFVSHFFANVIIGGIGGSVIKNITKQGSRIRGSKAVSPTVVNSVDDLLPKLKALPDKNVLIGQEVLVIKNNVTKNVRITQVTSRENLTLLTADDGFIYTLDEISEVPASVFTQPSITLNSSNSPSTLNSIDDAIKKNVVPGSLLEQNLLNLPLENKKIILRLINTIKNKGGRKISIKVNGKDITIDSNSTVSFNDDGLLVDGNTIRYVDIESSNIIKSNTSPQQPTQQPQNPVPQNQTTTPNTPNPTSSSTKQPIPKLNSYSETAIYESISDKIGVQFKESDNLILTLTNGTKYNLKQLNYDTNTEEFVITYFSSPAFPKPGVAKIKPKSLAYLQKEQTIISNVSKIRDPSKINNFLNNLKSSEVIGFEVNGADITNIQVTDLKFIPKNSIPFILQDSLNYKMKFKLSSGEIIEVDRYVRDFNIEKYSQNSNLPKVREVKKVTATTIREGYSRLITNKTEMITYLQNNQGTIIPYEGLENPGLLKLENFNETANNPLNKYFLVKQINNTNQYVIQFIDDTGSRPSPNRSVMTLENFVKFIEGFSAK
jgi:hypothetical protein